MHQVQVARHHQVADEFAEFDYPYRADRDIGAAAHEIEQAKAQKPRETLIDDFKRRHAPAHDALLGRQVVGAEARGRLGPVGSVTANNALEQGIHFFLRKKVVAHDTTTLNSRCSEFTRKVKIKFGKQSLWIIVLT